LCGCINKLEIINFLNKKKIGKFVIQWLAIEHWFCSLIKPTKILLVNPCGSGFK
jgi:hypothetical protein